jgi:hypothetical protein
LLRFAEEQVASPTLSFDPSSREALARLSPAAKEIFVYSYYRDAELRGANLLFRLLRQVEDGEAQVKLTEHLADEVRHAWLWTDRIRELGGHPLAVSDGYQVRMGRLAGLPRRLVDLFALTIVVEQRALKRYTDHLRRPSTPPRTVQVLQAVTRDEGWHVDWIRRKARDLAAEDGGADCLERALERYREVDRAVMTELEEVEREFLGA